MPASASQLHNRAPVRHRQKHHPTSVSLLIGRRRSRDVAVAVVDLFGTGAKLLIFFFSFFPSCQANSAAAAAATTQAK